LKGTFSLEDVMAQLALPLSATLLLDAAAMDVVHRGHAVIEYPVSAYIPLVLDAVDRLIEDPAAPAWGLYVPRAGCEPDDMDDGLIRRSKDYLYDNKWFFHYRPSLKSNLIARGMDVSAHESLFRFCGMLYDVCRSLAHTFASAFDQALPGYDIAKRHADVSDELDVLRILRYDRNVGGEIGKPHTDRDGFTFHIAETRPGLRIGDTRESYAAEKNHILVFPGQKFERVTAGRIRALPHDIVDNPAPDAESRWSVVFFAHMRE
jgi:2-oxoglutarate-Fe(II)-dependent oxygenase superfamily protein